MITITITSKCNQLQFIAITNYLYNIAASALES